MKYIVFFLLVFLLFPRVYAETTFFDSSDNAFIISNSVTSNEIGGTTGKIINEEGGCLYKWNCTRWGMCLLSGKQVRTCTNIGSCPDKYKSPKIEQNCSSSDITGKIIWKEVGGGSRVFIYPAIFLLAILIIVFLRKIILKKRKF